MLHAGLEGIEHGYELPEPMEQNLYHLTPEERAQRGIEQLPETLGEAIEIAAESELVLRILGEHTFKRFIEIKREEWEEYRVQVTPWELERFLLDPLAAGRRPPPAGQQRRSGRLRRRALARQQDRGGRAANRSGARPLADRQAHREPLEPDLEAGVRGPRVGRIGPEQLQHDPVPRREPPGGRVQLPGLAAAGVGAVEAAGDEPLRMSRRRRRRAGGRRSECRSAALPRPRGPRSRSASRPASAVDRRRLAPAPGDSGPRSRRSRRPSR